MEYLGVIGRGVNGIGRPAGISRPRFRHAPRWKKRPWRSHSASPPNGRSPPTSTTFDQVERLQEATSFLPLVAAGSVRRWKAPRVPYTPMIGPKGCSDPSGVE